MVLIFGFISLFFALLVISERNTMFSVFYLVGTFISMSFLLLVLKIDYLALLLIIVYVGAIVILFLFVVMMINIKLEDSSRSQFTPIGIIIIVIMILEVYTNYFLVSEVLPGNLYFLQINGKIHNIESLGQILYFCSNILYGSLILLIAMVGAIILTLNHSQILKRQDMFSKW